MKFFAVALAAAISLALVTAEDRRMIIGYKDGNGKAAIKARAKSVHYDLDKQNALAVTLPDTAIDGLLHNPSIAYIEEDLKRFPLGSVRGSAPGVKNQEVKDDKMTRDRHLAESMPYGVEMVEGHLLQFNQGATTKICIIDSGYDWGHEDLPSDVNVSGDDDVRGAGVWYEDGDGHGTHVAGTIAALGNDKGVVGVSPGVHLHIVRVFGDDGLWAYSSSLANAVNDCVSAGSNVISMSLGGGGSSSTEAAAFADADAAGALSIAAAGNDGNRRKSYPASYPIVASVAAVDLNGNKADFSQYNSEVEFAAPGVNVMSTVPEGTASVADVTVDGVGYVATAMEFAAPGTATGNLVDCGLGDGNDACPASGKVCLIQRGDISFADKVAFCEENGGVAAIIYNNENDIFSGTLGESSETSIPAFGVSGDDGATLMDLLGSSTSVSLESSGGNYDLFDGTSMATPHVSAVAALVWSHHSECTNQEIRNALAMSAEDKGRPGRDPEYGFGIVKAKAAHDYLNSNPCAGSGGNPPTTDDPLTTNSPSTTIGSCGNKGASCDGENVCCGSLKCNGKSGAKTCK